MVASGLGKRNGEDISFESERPLQALTVYGINGASYDVPVDRGLSLRCCLSAWGKQWAKKFKNIQAKDFSAYWRSLTNDYENYIKTSWYSSSYPFCTVWSVRCLIFHRIFRRDMQVVWWNPVRYLCGNVCSILPMQMNTAEGYTG